MSEIGKLVKSTRVSQGLTQKQLALAGGTGIRFIIDLESGKPTCQAEKVLHVLNMLGVKVEFNAPRIKDNK